MKAFLQIGNQSIEDLPPLKKIIELVGAVAPPAAATTDGGAHLLPRTPGTPRHKTRRKATRWGSEETFSPPMGLPVTLSGFMRKRRGQRSQRGYSGHGARLNGERELRPTPPERQIQTGEPVHSEG